MKIDKKQLKNKKILFIIPILLIFIGFGFSGLNLGSLYGGIENADDTYYATINIDNTGGSELVGYQQLITIPYKTGMQSDFDDIIFTELDGTIISHDKSSFTSGTNADFYISLDCSADSTKDIYVYYGNSAMTDQSDPANVYKMYDDFENADAWIATDTKAKATISSDMAYTGSTSAKIQTGTLMETLERTDIPTTENIIIEVMMYQSANSFNGASMMSSYTDGKQNIVGTYHDGISTGSTTNFVDRYDLTWYDTGFPLTIGWHKLSILYDGTNVKKFINDVQVDSRTYTTITGTVVLGDFWDDSNSGNHYFDKFLIRQYILSEPSITIGDSALVPITFPEGYDTITNTKTYTGSDSGILTLDHAAIPLSSVEGSLTYNEEGVSNMRTITISNSGVDGALTDFQYTLDDRTLPAYASSYAKLHYYTDLGCTNEISQYIDPIDDSIVTLNVDLLDGNTLIYERAEAGDATSDPTAVYDGWIDGTTTTGWTGATGMLSVSDGKIRAYSLDTLQNVYSPLFTVADKFVVDMEYNYADTGEWYLEHDYLTNDAGYAYVKLKEYEYSNYFHIQNNDGNTAVASTTHKSGEMRWYSKIDLNSQKVVTSTIYNSADSVIMTASDFTFYSTAGTFDVNEVKLRIFGGDVDMVNNYIDQITVYQYTDNTQSHSYETLDGGNDFTVVSGSTSDITTAVVSTPTAFDVTVDETTTETTISTGCGDFDYTASLIWDEGIDFTKSINDTVFIASGNFTPLETSTSSLITCNHTIDTSSYNTIITTTVDDVEYDSTISSSQILTIVPNLDSTQHNVSIQANLTEITIPVAHSSGGGSVSVPTTVEEETTETVIEKTTEIIDNTKQFVNPIENIGYDVLFILVFVLIGGLYFLNMKRK